MTSTRLVNLRTHRSASAPAASVVLAPATTAMQVGKKKPGRIVKAAAKYVSVEQMRPAIKSVGLALSHMGSLGAALNLQTSRGTLPPPQNWPGNIAWRPARYFGPFRGEGFAKIQILGIGGGWYFNDYFANRPDGDEYKPFFSNMLPTAATPDQYLPPGQVPYSNGMAAIPFHLDRLAYSSRYGGSIELLFIGGRDAGVDLRKDSLAWDLKGLELRIYVNPVKEALSGGSGPSSAYSRGAVYAELMAKEAVAYQVTSAGLSQALADPHEAELNLELQGLASSVASNQTVQQSARRFVCGFLWSQFPDLTGPDMIVDRVYISDDMIDLVTRKGIPVVSVAFRAANVQSFGADLVTEPEHSVTLSSDHVYSNQIVHGPSRSFYLDSNGDDTGWVNVGSWTLDEASQVGEIVLYMSGVEVDFPDSDDRFETVEAHLTLDVSELQAAHASHQYGLIEKIQLEPGYADFVNPDIFGEEWMIFFDLEATIGLGLR